MNKEDTRIIIRQLQQTITLIAGTIKMMEYELECKKNGSVV